MKKLTKRQEKELDRAVLAMITDPSLEEEVDKLAEWAARVKARGAFEKQGAQVIEDTKMLAGPDSAIELRLAAQLAVACWLCGYVPACCQGFLFERALEAWETNA